MDTLFDAAYACLIATEIDQKLHLTETHAAAWRAGALSHEAEAAPVQTLETPGLPARLQLVAPRDLPRRRLSTPAGHAALLHAIAHIEFNAINLAWDAVYRFRDLPRAYYDDWVRVADEERQHFQLLRAHLQQFNADYGDFPAHNGWWELALETASDPLLRMALVPRVMEARGLDVTPGIMARLADKGDQRAVEILQIILRDEIGHVAAGSRWFRVLCTERGLVPETTFIALIQQHLNGQLRPPFHLEARLAAGFDASELAQLATLCPPQKQKTSP